MTTKKPAAAADVDQADPLAFVRARLDATTTRDWMRFALDANLSMRTLHNIRNGNAARYNNVIALRDAIRKADEAAAAK